MSAILELENLSKTFSLSGHSVQALCKMSLTVSQGSCHAIVGESGSGKTTLGNLVLGVISPSTGTVRFNGVSLTANRPKELRRKIQAVQQNPLSALNPRKLVGTSVRLPLDVHCIGNRESRNRRVAELLVEVDLDPQYAERLPRGLSGGELQRIAIARALAGEPDLIVLDEPTSALDVLVQSRVLQLLARLRCERNLTYLFITHDLAVVRAIADTVSIFQKGFLVETSTVDAVFLEPRHQYTRDLIGSIPVITDDEARLRDAIRSSGKSLLPRTPGST